MIFFFIDHCEERYIIYKLYFQGPNSNCCPPEIPPPKNDTIEYNSTNKECDNNYFYYKEKNICLSSCETYNLFDDVETKTCTYRCKSNKYIENNKCVDKCTKDYFIYNNDKCIYNCSLVSLYNDIINR